MKIDVKNKDVVYIEIGFNRFIYIDTSLDDVIIELHEPDGTVIILKQ